MKAFTPGPTNIGRQITKLCELCGNEQARIGNSCHMEAKDAARRCREHSVVTETNYCTFCRRCIEVETMPLRQQIADLKLHSDHWLRRHVELESTTRELVRWLDADNYPITGANSIMQRLYRLLEVPTTSVRVGDEVVTRSLPSQPDEADEDARLHPTRDQYGMGNIEMGGDSKRPVIKHHHSVGPDIHAIAKAAQYMADCVAQDLKDFPRLSHARTNFGLKDLDAALATYYTFYGAEVVTKPLTIKPRAKS